MPEKPSWQSSTLSQLLVIAIALYGVGAVALIWRGEIKSLEPFQWLINLLLPLYGVKRGLEAMGNGNHPAVESPPSP